LPAWICATCGNHYPEAGEPPASCLICADERQWVPPDGQRWTTPAELAAGGRHVDLWTEEPGLHGLGVTPAVGIGQRGLIVRTAEGNLLWDPPGYLDDAGIEQVRQLGGLRAVTASHPHFYGAMAEWGRAFGADVWVPEADAGWVTRPDPAIRTWHTRLPVLPGVTVVQCGGHFPGSAVVHWAEGAGGAGTLLTGDTIMVTPGEDRLTFVWSAPNRLPLPESAVRGILGALSGTQFDRIYGGWAPTVRSGARGALEASAERYIQFLRGEAPEPG
jgi:glyoxylase-like metal-dependent hydrolase (beta-lactamase superfamily II)